VTEELGRGSFAALGGGPAMILELAEIGIVWLTAPERETSTRRRIHVSGASRKRRIHVGDAICVAEGTHIAFCCRDDLRSRLLQQTRESLLVDLQHHTGVPVCHFAHLVLGCGPEHLRGL